MAAAAPDYVAVRPMRTRVERADGETRRRLHACDHGLRDVTMAGAASGAA